MFVNSARYYDAIYASIDYQAASARVMTLAERHRRSTGGTLLDVACGTGRHLSYFRERYHSEGLDLDPVLLAIAAERNPGVLLHQGDMLGFDLDKTFDMVTCLGGSIAAVQSLSGLHQALATMRRHLAPGGVLVIQPWLSPYGFEPGRIDVRTVEQPDLKLVRMGNTTLEGNVAQVSFHYLLGTEGTVSYFTEDVPLGLFTDEEYTEALRACGLEVVYDTQGQNGARYFVGLAQG